MDNRYTGGIIVHMKPEMSCRPTKINFILWLRPAQSDISRAINVLDPHAFMQRRCDPKARDCNIARAISSLWRLLGGCSACHGLFILPDGLSFFPYRTPALAHCRASSSRTNMANLPVNLSISVPTLVGSLLSCTASFLALCLHAIVPPPRRHFRHALIVNLLLAGRTPHSG